MNQHRLLFELDQVAARFRLLRFWQLLAAAWLIAALLGLGVWGLKFGTGGQWGAAVPALAIAAAVLAGIGIWQATAWARDPAWVARRVEAQFPELHSCLLAAVEQRPSLPGGRFGYLQSNVIHQALAHADRHEWRQVVPMGRIATAAFANLAAFALFVAVLAGIAFTVAPESTAAALASLTTSSMTGAALKVTVEPGDAEVERGTSLLVLARVQGPMPPEATLVYQAEGDDEARVAMSASLNDPVFGARIPIVDAPLTYTVEMSDYRSSVYRVTVFEYPRLEKADAKLVFPSYTGQEPRLVQDVRTVSVVEGTELTLTCYLNKQVVQATLTEEKQPPIALAAIAGEKSAYQTVIECDRSQKLKLELIDDAGRKNNKVVTFTINVLPNQPVALKPVFPARDLEVSALEELDLKATAWDDFGVKRFGLSYNLSGQDPVDVVLGENAAAKQKHEVAHSIRLEELKAQPDDLLSYHFWAEDFAPDGSVRRSESDMYFAEVRPFDEIFRQGEQPPGGQQQQQQQGQGQNAQQAQQLGELQKQIINATWKVIRREIGGKLTDTFKGDTEEIKTSQGSALEQTAALAERVQDPESQDHIAAVLKAMQEAIQQLAAAQDQPSHEPLPAALKSEQAAYQALLKLRAREHNIVRQNQRQSGRSSSSRSQQQRQQMQQLELKEDENRYETQRQAQDQNESAEERENRQVLNRLRELAQRQHDLNERLKELQTALEEARTEEEKEELKRQLQRLQDEQREILQNTEELQSRMETPENSERMAQEREQLQQTREQVQRASEALEQTQITQAAASGTRAEQNFEDLRNEFRRRASSRFSEDMQRMQSAARELDQKEQELSQRLREAAEPQADQPKSLRDSGEREQIAEQLAEQRQRLSGLEEQMRQTIQDSEQTEPLLAEKLYDAARTAQDRKIEQTLEQAERSLRQGLLDDARQREEPAAQGISQLREGIDKAAQAILGDETEALRRAREELQNLSRELNDEIDQNDPSRQGQPNGQQPGEQQPGQQQPGGRQPGQEGQPQQGENQQGQQQPGQKGQQSGDQKGEPGQKGKGQKGDGQKGESQQGESGQKGEGQKGEGQKGQGGQKGQAGQKGQGQGQGRNQAQDGQASDGSRQPGQQQSGQRGQRQGQRQADGGNLRGGAGPFEDYVPRDMMGPLTGGGFREWSDRLRDVEEMVADPELRAEAARIRERARMMRAELRRHSTEPNWDLVQQQVAGPLVELRDRVATELLRRTAKQAIIPLDRDPVPPKYSEKTRLYYERLGIGSGQ